MAFEKVMSLIAGSVDIAPPKDVHVFEEVDTGIIPKGAVAKFVTASGKITLSTADDNVVALVALEEIARDGEGRCAWIMPGAVYRAPLRQEDGTALTGATDKHANINVGSRALISTNGLAVDGESDHDDSAPLTIIKMVYDNTSDTTRAKAYVYVVFNRCACFGINDT